MDTDVDSLAYETVRKVQPNIPLASKDLSISLGSKTPNIPLNVCKCYTEKTYSTRDIGTQTIRKSYSESSTLLPDYKKKTFMSLLRIEPATDVLCHNISVALPTLLPSSYCQDRILHTRTKNKQSFIHVSYQYDNGCCFRLYSNDTQIQ